ncbi:MAG: SDR family NAD(P)-dependent oxidoreductase [Luteitalea sp.]|nr:SDR family NAD(P)-dependent oxidoreductase [Luteitalea sp.]
MTPPRQANRTPPEVVVITGASAGVGRALARAYGARAAHVGLIARGRDGLDAARIEVERAGGRVVVCPADVADASQVEAAAATIENRFGPPDVWINNAMVAVFSPIIEMTAEEFRRVTDVTYLGVVHGTLAALRRMFPRNRGRIVQVGSALAYRGIPLQSAYCAAKHAVQGFCDSLRAELLHDGSQVTVTMVQLPALNTPQFDWVKSRLPNRAQPVPPVFQPEVAAKAIIWAAETGRREVYVGAPTVAAIVGNKLAPGLIDRSLARFGYAAQQTREPEDPDRPDNLWTPLPGDHGAHGRFDSVAHGSSAQLWLSQHRGGVGLAIASVVLSIAGAWRVIGVCSGHRPTRPPATSRAV